MIRRLALTRPLSLTWVLIVFALVGPVFAPVFAKDTAWPKQIEIGQETLPLIGSGVATYLWFDVYDAALYAPEGITAGRVLSPDTPKVLMLRYRHAVTVEDIQKASWQTLDKQLTKDERTAIKPKVDALQSSMKNVSPGDQYTLIWQPADGQSTPELQLKLNDRVVFRSADAALAQTYFGIWLGKPPLSGALKHSLLGRR